MTLRMLVLLIAGSLLPRHAISSPSAQRWAALAQNEASISLDWSAPAPCPDGDAIRSDVIRLTGSTTPIARHLKVRASIRPGPGTGWTLALVTELDGVSGERTLSGASCESLSAAAALMLALILNPELAMVAPQPVPDQEPTPRAATIASFDEHWPRPRWLLGAQAGIQTGVIGNLSPTFALSLGIALGRLSVRLMPNLTPPQDVLSDNQAKLGGRLWVGTVATLGCWATPAGRVALNPCFGLDVSRLNGRGLGVLQPLERTVYWASAELAVFAAVPLSRGVMLEFGGIGIVPLGRPSVYLEQIGTVSRPAAFGLRALGGLAWVSR